MILEFGILNFKLIIPLLYPIFSVANKIITKTLLKSPHILLSSPLFTFYEIHKLFIIWVTLFISVI